MAQEPARDARPAVAEHDGGTANTYYSVVLPKAHRLASSRWRAFAEAHPRGLESTVAAFVYTVLALAYFWWPIHNVPANTVIGAVSADVEQNLWYLKWWPYAITHHMNPFFMHVMWVPWGYNLAWQTSFPLLSLLMWPVTATAGVVAAYNLLLLLSFVLAAWCTFLLCRYITHQFWAALVGGYLFGFSGYMVAQATEHIFLVVLFFVPLSIYLFLLRRDGKLGRVPYIVLMALPVTGFFLVTIEMFTLYVLFLWGGIALYFLLAPSERRATLTLAIETAGAFVVTGLLCAPYLYFMLIGGYPAGAVHNPETFSGDLLGFVVPTKVFLTGALGSMQLAGGNTAEQDSYLGLPLVLLMLVFVLRYWSKPAGKVLIALAAVAVAFTLGPYLHLADHVLVHVPVTHFAFYHMPILEKSLPIRYALFVALLAAVMGSVVLAQQLKTLWLKVLVGLLACVALLPNTLGGHFVNTLDLPAFFSTPLYQQYIKPNDTVLVLPISYGHDMLWQQETNYYFTLAAGYGGEPPHGDDILPIYYMLATGNASRYLITSGGQVVGNTYTYYLEHFLATRHVSEIVLGEAAYSQWAGYLGFLREAPQHVGGVWLFHTPQEIFNASVPGQLVPGDDVPRPYTLDAAQWNDTTLTLDVPAHSTAKAVTTIIDQFPRGEYAATVDISSAATGPVATAYAVVNGAVVATQPLQTGSTRLRFHVPADHAYIQIEIRGLGSAAFSIGNTVMTRAS